ncbi:MAG: hypothetical protein IPJ77_19655 [Planctomycetes bacterium]|nr:hypothetical protein [Planctomycetota bacterium]
MEHDSELFAARWALGLACRDELVARAEAARNAGCSGPALAELGALRDPPRCDVRELVDRALDELVALRPSAADACLHVARAHARAIVSGEVEAVEGARRIVHEVWDQARELDDRGLAPFVYWEDEWYDADSPERVAFCEAAIVEAAKDLLAAPPSSSRS